MSTLKASNIQPQSDSDPLILSTNATERLRIDTSGTLHLKNSTATANGNSLIYFNNETTNSGAPSTDGAVVKYLTSEFGGSTTTGVDGLIIEKTDANASMPDGGIAFTRRGSDGVRSYDLTISGGNIGIGITSPASALEVQSFVSSATTEGITGTVANAGILLNVDFQAPASTKYSSGLFWRDRVLNTLPLAGIWVGDENSNGASLLFGTSQTYANGINKIGMTIRNGNVGIGVTGPVAALDVSGISGSGKQVWIRDGSGGGLGSAAGAGLKLEYVGVSNCGNIQAYDYSTSTAKNLTLCGSGGKVSIRAGTDPNAYLTVGTGSYTAINDYAANFTADSNDAGWGGVLFSQNSDNAFKVWAQGTGNATASSNYLNFDLVNVGTGLTLDSRSVPAMTLRGNGSVEVATSLKVANATLTPAGSAPMFACRAFGSGSPSTSSPFNYGQNCTATWATTGIYTVTLTTPMANTNYVVVATANQNATAPTTVSIVSASQFTVTVYGGSDNRRTNSPVSWAVFG